MVTNRRSDGKFFKEARPVKDAIYFPANPDASTAIVICLYNEQGAELDRTIQTLADSGAALDVVVVADGLAKLSDSMRHYLQRVFELADPELLNDKGKPWGSADQMFVSNYVVRGSSGSRFCVLLKRFNHKKINSRTCRVTRTPHNRHVTAM